MAGNLNGGRVAALGIALGWAASPVEVSNVVIGLQQSNFSVSGSGDPNATAVVAAVSVGAALATTVSLSFLPHPLDQRLDDRYRRDCTNGHRTHHERSGWRLRTRRRIHR